MQKPKEIVEFIELVVQKLGLPGWAFKVVLICFLVVLLLYALDLIFKLIDGLKPRFYNAEQKKRALRRQRFASHLAGEIERINRKEDWDDYHFTELEAEVEAEGRRQVFSYIPFLKRARSGLRREKSLSKAIKNSSEKVIQLEGDPGSGKSVALRHLALKMAKNASSSRSLKSVIPIFVNLKELNRSRDEKIDRNLIESFVLKTLKRANDRNIEDFLDKEFFVGMEESAWFFLFDSFDEIPEVLSSTDEDDIIKSYADAISDFLGGFNKCRGVVASRHYRGPGKSGWAKFRIMELSETRRLELIANADLDRQVEDDIKGQLGMAGPEIRELSKNPMLLSLLCVHMKVGNPFPQSAHTVLATYLENRLERDRDRLKQRFRIEPNEIRDLAEKVAFCMAADRGLGLTPSRQAITQSMANLGMPVRDTTRFEALLDGLEYIKLGRSENDDVVGESRLFTFAHRRFQEYFATCVVLREPDRVSKQELLRDARWRETTVVIFQTQPEEKLAALLNEAQRMLSEMVNSIPDGLRVTGNELEEQAEGVEQNGEQAEDVEQAGELEGQCTTIKQFPWPAEALHLLGLLQDGFNRRMGDLPEQMRECIGTIALSATETGGPFDKNWALETAGAAKEEVLLKLMRNAFQSGRQLLQGEAYRQVSRLSSIPKDIVGSINRTFVSISNSGRLKRDYLSTKTYLSRMDHAEHFLSTLRLLMWTPIVDWLLHAVAVIALLAIASWRPWAQEAVEYEVLYISWISILLSLILSLSLRWLITHSMEYFALGRFLISLLIAAISLSMIPPWINTENEIAPVVITIFFGSIGMWACSSSIATRSGKFTRLVWWPVMPFVIFLIIFSDFRSTAKTVIGIVRDLVGKIGIRGWAYFITSLVITIGPAIRYPQYRLYFAIASIILVMAPPFILIGGLMVVSIFFCWVCWACLVY